MFEHFQAAGTLPDEIDRLNREAIEGAISAAKDFSIHDVIPSAPVAV